MTRPRHWLACIAAVAVLGALNACVSGPVVRITFTTASAPPGTGIVVEVDAVATSDAHPVRDIYPFDMVTTAAFTHTIETQPGALAHASIKVHATEPDQIVGCAVWRNGVEVPGSQGAGSFGRPAVCISPPA